MSPGTAPTGDDDARSAIKNDHTRSFIVEAGAGTGKTTALVGRIVALVIAGVDIRHVAAITFTEAAAAELRDRVRFALEEVVSGSDGRSAPEISRGRCHDALEHLDDSSLSTLHGFARRILAAYPLEAGLPPEFDVLDQIEAAIERDQRWGEFKAELLEDPSMETVLLCAHVVGIDLAKMRDLAVALDRDLDRLSDTAFASRPLPAVAV